MRKRTAERVRSTRVRPLSVQPLPVLLTAALFVLPGCPEGGDDDDDATGSSPPPASQQIQVSQSSLEFGEVAIGNQGEQQLEVSNNGESPLLLTITIPQNPDGQYTVTGEGGALPDELAGGATVTLTVSFAPSIEGDAAGTLRVDSTDPVAPRIDLPLSATALPGSLPDDDDNDGFTELDGDCDDSDPEVNPEAAEACDEVDNDCDEEVDESGLEFYRDADQDGHGTADSSVPGSVVEGCEVPPGYAVSSDDCDDLEPDVHPGATEPCDGIDNDCDETVDEDGESTFYTDSDGDGHGNPDSSFLACSPGPGASTLGDDCDDSSADIYPQATELCDSKDNDCDGEIDDNSIRTFYEDRDGDGYGDEMSQATGCEPPEGYVEVSGDCNELEPAINPGALEACDGIDNDCDGTVDGALELTYYRDTDGDGHGDADDFTSACQEPEGYAEAGDDCDDANAEVFPGAAEACDGADNDCDGSTDEEVTSTYYTDGDGDGFGDGGSPVEACGAGEGRAVEKGDCNDADDSIYPGAAEACDSKDNDCDGQKDEDGVSTFYLDYDGDQHGDPAISKEGCNNPNGYVPAGDDCNDRNAAIYPGATEACNTKDDDCDGEVDEEVLPTWYLDADHDGYGNPEVKIEACSKPASYTDKGGDCNDLDSTSSPEGTEVCDSRDNDCDGFTDEGVLKTFYADEDRDGFGDHSDALEACTAPAHTVTDDTDCDDSRSDVNPEEIEVCDGVDNDCDTTIDEEVKTTWYLDGDSDGYGVPSSTRQACEAPEGYVASSTDCNDGDATVYPGATEVCDGRDEDCDGTADDGVQKTFYADADEDTYGDSAHTTRSCTAGPGYVTDATDCDDSDSSVHPGASEVCDSKDNDCDRSIDESGDAAQTAWYLDQDNDGFGVTSVVKYACSQPAGYSAEPGDCMDADPDTYPDAPEQCEGRDNDCDGDKSPPGAPVAGNNGPVCVGATLNLSASTEAGATYAWTGPNGFTSSEQNPVRSNMTPADAGTYSVKVTRDGCTSTAATTTVTVNDPDADFSFDPTAPEPGEAVSFVPVISDASRYAWTFQNGSPSSSTDQNPTVSWSTEGTYTVSLTVTVDGCSSTSQNAITVKEIDPTSCKTILQSDPSSPSGNYQIDPDGTGGNAPFTVYCDMTTKGGGWSRCLEFKNTSSEDVTNNSWFDKCVDYSLASWTGTEVMIKLVNGSGNAVYSAKGSRANTWTYNQITSTTSPENQYHSGNHNYLITLDTSDKLMIAGRNSANAGCGGSMGNGYGIVLYPSSPSYYSNPKAFIMPYRQYVSPYTGVRSFTGWSTGHEITYYNGAGYNSCNGIPSSAAFTGSFEFYVR